VTGGNMKNNTLNFINIVNLVVKENKEYFSILEKIKTNNIQKFKINILDDLQIVELILTLCLLTKINN
jgi:hypothetical protein